MKFIKYLRSYIGITNPCVFIPNKDKGLIGIREKSSIKYKSNIFFYNLNSLELVFIINNVKVFRGSYDKKAIFEDVNNEKPNFLQITFYDENKKTHWFEIEALYLLLIYKNYFLFDLEKNNDFFLKCLNIKNDELVWQNAYKIQPRVFLNINNYIVFGNSEFKIFLLDILTGKTDWSLDLSPYFVPSPLLANGDPIFSQSISKVLYCSKNEVLIIFLMPYKLLGISIEDGQVLWEIEYRLNSNELYVESGTGLLYVLSRIFVEDERSVIYRYNVMNTKTGEIELERDYDYHDINAGKESLYFTNFAGVYNDSVYFTTPNGEIFKLNKSTGEIVERYKHDKPFYSPPQIFNNRLFITEGDDKLERTLVFDID